MPCTISDITLPRLVIWDLDELDTASLPIVGNRLVLPSTKSNAKTLHNIVKTRQSEPTTVIFAVQNITVPVSNNLFESIRTFIHDDHESFNPRSTAEQNKLAASNIKTISTTHELQLEFHDFLAYNSAYLQQLLATLPDLRKFVISRPDIACSDYYLYFHDHDLGTLLVQQQKQVILQLFGIFANLLQQNPAFKLELSFLDHYFPIPELLANKPLLSRLSNLKHLHLSFCPRDSLMQTDTTIADNIAALLAHLPRLESLSLSHESLDDDEGCAPGDEDIIATVLRTVQLPRLKALKLRRLMFRCEVLLGFVKRHTSLRKLKVYYEDVLPNAKVLHEALKGEAGDLDFELLREW